MLGSPRSWFKNIKNYENAKKIGENKINYMESELIDVYSVFIYNDCYPASYYL